MRDPDRTAAPGGLWTRTRFVAPLLWALLTLLAPTPGLRAASHTEKEQVREQDQAISDAFFTNGTILNLSLEISEEGLESLRKTPREYVRVTLRDGATVHSNVALHLKGGSGSFRRVDDRPGLTVDFNRYDPEARFHGLKKLHLNNGAQDPTRLSEFIGGQLFRDAGVPAARAAHALLDLNGRKLGLYVVMESMDKDFLGRNFTDKHGNLYGQTRPCDVTDPIERMEGIKPLTYEELKALAAAVSAEDARVRLESLGKTLEVDRFLSFMAMEVLLTHWDGYTFNRHNYRIYQEVDTGRMVFIPHDLDQLMLTRRRSPGLLPAARGLVAQAVMNTPELRTRYLERICSLATNLFVVPRLTERVDRAAARLLPTIAAYDAELAATFTNTTAEFKDRIRARGARLERQLAILHGGLAPLAFKNETAPLTNWQADSYPTMARLDRFKTDDGKRALRIKLVGNAEPKPAAKDNPKLLGKGDFLRFGAWSTAVLLEPGWYRFEGLVRCAGVESSRARKWNGAGLLAPGDRPASVFRLTGDMPWQKLDAEFEVTSRDEIELACELRSTQGEACFAESSLQLVRLPTPPAKSPTARERKGLVAPGSTVDRAIQAVEAVAEAASQDPGRPVFHFRPAAQWMGEISGVAHYNGRYHLFFQFNPWEDTAGKGTGWGHAASANLMRWQGLPPALLPDAREGSTWDGPGSVALDGADSPMLFYTHTPDGFPKSKHQPWAALPQDEALVRWQKINLGLAPGQGGVPRGMAPEWGDMRVFRSAGRTFATFKQSQGLVCEAQNPGLTQWKVVGKCKEFSGDCMSLCPLDAHQLLIQSNRPISGRVGEFDADKLVFRFRDRRPQILDYGWLNQDAAEARGLLGATAFTDVKGRTILLGWIGGFPPQHHWNGIMALPRVLHLNGDQLTQEPLPELAQFRGRGGRLIVKPTRLSNEARVLPEAKLSRVTLGAALEVLAELTPGSATNYGVRLRGATAEPSAVVIRYSPGRLSVAGREVPYDLPAGEALQIRFFLDKSVLEAFLAGGRIAVTRLVNPGSSDLRLEVFAEGGDILVQRLEAWTVRPSW